MGSGDKDPHWGDRNIHSGRYQGQTFQSVLFFDLSELAPGSQVLFAEVELTGLNRSNLGAEGSWTLKILPPALLADWNTRTAKDLGAAVPVGQIGAALTPSVLGEGQVNQFVFGPDQLPHLDEALNGSGQIALRIDGPTGPADSLFSWDGGDSDPQIGAHPVLHLVAVPAQFKIITNTPTPQNVLTAAAVMAEGTQSAERIGTPTPLPREFATAVPLVVVTSQPTPANPGTATAQADYATAVALTTGTFTPTPLNWVTPTPTPLLVTVQQLAPFPSPTVRVEIPVIDYLKTPFPVSSGLVGNIAFLTDRDGGVLEYWLMDKDGNTIGRLTGNDYYRAAFARELFSPDHLFQVDVGKDAKSRWEIVVLDIQQGILKPLIVEDPKARGIGSYHPAWSPAGNKIAYVSERTGNAEIYVYDAETKVSTRLTDTPVDPNRGFKPYNKHPTWSPDGTQILFFSNRGSEYRDQLWIVDEFGNGLHPFSISLFNDSDPIWIKK